MLPFQMKYSEVFEKFFHYWLEELLNYECSNNVKMDERERVDENMTFEMNL